MCKFKFNFIFILLNLIYISEQYLLINHNETLSYKNLIEISGNCTYRDSCNKDLTRRRDLNSPKERNCLCDDDCVNYGDCCIDANKVNLMKESKKYFQCYDMIQYGGVYMIDRCPNNLTNHLMKIKCENETFSDDPISSLPVTDHHSRVTYKNVYCAICHNSQFNLTFWQPRVECIGLEKYNQTYKNLTNDYLLENLVYFDEVKRWGIVVDFPYMCDIDPIIPNNLEHLLRHCKSNLIKSCPKDFNDNYTVEACSSYQAIVYYQSERYYNPHCALCNGLKANKKFRLYCEPIDGRNYNEFITRSQFQPDAFSILLDLNTIKSGNSNRIGKRSLCNDINEIYDPFLRKCRNVFCSFESYKYINGKCVDLKQNNKNSINRAMNVDEMKFNETNNFEDCPKMLLNENEYFILKNNSIYLRKHDKINQHWQYNDHTNKTVIICSPFNYMQTTNANKFNFDLGLITIIGLSISILFLIIHLVIFLIMSEIINLSSLNLASYSLSLLIAYTSYVLIQFKFIKTNNLFCVSAGIVMYFFFLLSFMWMNIMAFDVWRTLRRAANELRMTNGMQKLRFSLYTLYGVTLTSIIVGLAITSDLYSILVPEEYRPGFGIDGKCWFTNRKALLFFFALPLSVIMLMNMIFFVLTARIIMSTRLISKTNSIKSNQGQSKRDFKLYIRLTLLMGLTWISGFIATYTDEIYFWYIFVLLNTLHGLFIFIFFSCTGKVFTAIKNRLKKSDRGNSSSSGLTNSSRLNTSHTNLSATHQLNDNCKQHQQQQQQQQKSSNPWCRKDNPSIQITKH